MGPRVLEQVPERCKIQDVHEAPSSLRVTVECGRPTALFRLLLRLQEGRVTQSDVLAADFVSAQRQYLKRLREGGLAARIGQQLGLPRTGAGPDDGEAVAPHAASPRTVVTADAAPADTAAEAAAAAAAGACVSHAILEGKHLAGRGGPPRPDGGAAGERLQAAAAPAPADAVTPGAVAEATEAAAWGDVQQQQTRSVVLMQKAPLVIIDAGVRQPSNAAAAVAAGSVGATGDGGRRRVAMGAALTARPPPPPQLSQAPASSAPEAPWSSPSRPTPLPLHRAGHVHQHLDQRPQQHAPIADTIAAGVSRGGDGGASTAADAAAATGGVEPFRSRAGSYDFDEREMLGFSAPRKLAARLCGHPDFELGVVVLIAANTVALALHRPTEPDDSSWNQALFWAEAACNGLFTAEMLLRATALGGPRRYLRRPWNAFDAAMVAVGYAVLVPTTSSSTGGPGKPGPGPGNGASSGGLRALRALRALRPLRTVTRFESLRAIVVCFLEAVPLLGSAAGLMALFMLLWAVAGAVLFGPVYHRKCYLGADPGRPEENTGDPDQQGCGGWRHCPANYTCLETAASDAVNIAGFGNTGAALLTVFQVITLTGWNAAMWRTIDATGPAAVVYFVSLAAIGAYVLVNLFLAVLKIKFGRAQTAFRARHSGRIRGRRNSVATLLDKARSRFGELSARRSASRSFTANLSQLITTRLSRNSDSGSRSTSEVAVPAPAEGFATAAAAAVASAANVVGDGGGGCRRGNSTEGAADAGAYGNGRRCSISISISGDAAGRSGVARTSGDSTRGDDNGGGRSGGKYTKSRNFSTGGGGGNESGDRSSGDLGQLNPRVIGDGPASLPKRAESAGRPRSEPVRQNPWPELELAAAAGPPWSDSAAAAATGPAPAAKAAGKKVAEAEAAVAANRDACTAPYGRREGGTDGNEGLRCGACGSESDRGGGRGGGGRSTPLGQARLKSEQSSPLREPSAEDAPAGNESVGIVAGIATPGSLMDLPPPRQLTFELQSRQQQQQQPQGSRAHSISRNAVVPSPPSPPATAAATPATSPLPRSAFGRAPSPPPRRWVALPSPRRHQPQPSALASASSPLPRSALRNAAACGGCSAGGGGASFSTLMARSEAAAAADGAQRQQTQPQPQQPLPPPPQVGRALTRALTFSRGATSGLRPIGPQMLLNRSSNVAMAALMMDPTEFDELVAGEPLLRRLHLRAVFRARLAVESPAFSHSMLVIIFANTAVLAMEYDGMSASYERALGICNYVFTVLFTLEVAIKIFGMGLWDYFKDGFNLFDGLIVITSWLEIILAHVHTAANLNAMAALRAVRTLRLLKALRYLSSLRRISAKLLASFSSFAAVAVLIFLFWGVFAIVGLHVFGGLRLPRQPYPNFDTFLNSLVTTFNILTLENYQNNMYDTVRATNYGSVVFFVAWIVIGKYILLTLFLAVTLEAFEAKYDEQGAGGSSRWVSQMVRSAIMASAVGSVLGSARRTASRGESRPSLSSLADSIRSSEGPWPPITTANGLNQPNQCHSNRNVDGGPDAMDRVGAAATTAGGRAGLVPATAHATAGAAAASSAGGNIDNDTDSAVVAAFMAAAARPYGGGDDGAVSDVLLPGFSGTGMRMRSDGGSCDGCGGGGDVVLQPAQPTLSPGPPREPGPVAEKADHPHLNCACATGAVAASVGGGESATDGFAADARGPRATHDVSMQPRLETSPVLSRDGDTGSPPPFETSAAATSIPGVASAVLDRRSPDKFMAPSRTSVPSHGGGTADGGSAAAAAVQLMLSQRDPPPGVVLPSTLSQWPGLPYRKDLARSTSMQSPAWPVGPQPSASSLPPALPPPLPRADGPQDQLGVGLQSSADNSATATCPAVVARVAAAAVLDTAATAAADISDRCGRSGGGGRNRRSTGGASSGTGCLSHGKALKTAAAVAVADMLEIKAAAAISTAGFGVEALPPNVSASSCKGLTAGEQALSAPPPPPPVATAATAVATRVPIGQQQQLIKKEDTDIAAAADRQGLTGRKGRSGGSSGGGSGGGGSPTHLTPGAPQQPALGGPVRGGGTDCLPPASVMVLAAAARAPAAVASPGAATGDDEATAAAAAPLPSHPIHWVDHVRKDRNSSSSNNSNSGRDNNGSGSDGDGDPISAGDSRNRRCRHQVHTTTHTHAHVSVVALPRKVEVEMKDADAGQAHAAGIGSGWVGGTCSGGNAATAPPTQRRASSGQFFSLISSDNDRHCNDRRDTARRGVGGAADVGEFGSARAAGLRPGRAPEGPPQRSLVWATSADGRDVEGGTGGSRIKNASVVAVAAAKSDDDGSGSGRSRPTGHSAPAHRRRGGRIPLEGRALFVVGPDNRLRRVVYFVVGCRPFEYALFLVILANCVMMALEGPSVGPRSQLGRALFWGDAACTAIFTAEMIAKVFAWTFVAYIREITNQVDFVVVVTGLLGLALTKTEAQAVSALRSLRALKPLRLLTRSSGMRLVFRSVVLSLGAMAHVSVLVIMFLLIFAILGVQLFAGKLYRCNDDAVSGRDECVGAFLDPATGVTLERSWDNMWPNFDNVGNALLSCFVVASLNGYSELMIATLSAPPQRGQQPALNANPGAFFWYVGFTVLVSVTLLNLYVGVIFAQFSRIRNMSTTGSAFLTAQQQEWVEMSRAVFRLRPPDKAGRAPPRGTLRAAARRLAQSPGLERAMLGVIVANVAVLATTWYGQPPIVDVIQNRANIVFSVIYAAEAALKLYGLGVRLYFSDPWNRFDFSVVILCAVEAALTLLALHAGYVRVLRVFRLQRLLRVARLVRRSKGVKALFQALVMSLPAFGNVGALIGLLFFMYAYVGVLLFGRVRRDDAASAINHAASFSNFGVALSALLRVATGDNWTDVMYGCMVQPPDCSHAAGDCGTWLALPYFLSFFLLIAIILLNLFTAVIIENFEKVHEQDEWRLTPQNLEDFVMLWSEYDDGSGTISPSALELVLLRLDPPLGLGPYADNKEVLRFVYDLDIPLVGGRVPFHKTAFELVKRCSQADIPDGQLKAQLDGLAEAFFQDLGASQRDEQMHFTVAFSVMLIQRRWRSRFRAERLRRKRAWRDARRDATPYNALLNASGLQRVAEALVRDGARAAAAAAVATAGTKLAVAGSTAAVPPPRLVATATSFGTAAAAVAAGNAKARTWAWTAGTDPRVSAAGTSTAAAGIMQRISSCGAIRNSLTSADSLCPRAVSALRWRFNPNLVPPGLAVAVSTAAAAAAAVSATPAATQGRELPQSHSQQQQQQQQQASLLPWIPLRDLAFWTIRRSGNNISAGEIPPPTAPLPPPPTLAATLAQYDDGDALLSPPAQRACSGTGRTRGFMWCPLRPAAPGSCAAAPSPGSLRPRCMWMAASDGGVGTGAAVGTGISVDASSVGTVMPADGGPPEGRQAALLRPSSEDGGGGGGGVCSGLRNLGRYFGLWHRGGAQVELGSDTGDGEVAAAATAAGGRDNSRTSFNLRSPTGISPGVRTTRHGVVATSEHGEAEADDAASAAQRKHQYQAMIDPAMAAGALVSGVDEAFTASQWCRKSFDVNGGGGSPGSARPSSAASDGGGGVRTSGGRHRGHCRGGGDGAGSLRLRLPRNSGDVKLGDEERRVAGGNDSCSDDDDGAAWLFPVGPMSVIREETARGSVGGGVGGDSCGAAAATTGRS